MPIKYASGELVKPGDHVRYHGEAGEVEFVVESASPVAESAWYLEKLGPGAMLRVPEVFGAVYVSDTAEDELLEFVSRAAPG